MRIRIVFFTFFSLLAISACQPSTPQSSKTGTGNVQAVPPEKKPQTVSELQAPADKGDLAAQFDLGMMYLEGSGVLQDARKGVDLLTRAANQGDAMAQFNVGMTYYQGVKGVAQNYEKAIEWFTKGVANNDDRSEYNLGVMYYRGEGMVEDRQKAFDLFLKSALQGYGKAAYNLGVMYARGEGTKKPDVVEAYGWFTLAGNFGDEKAAGVLKQLTNEFTATQKSRAEVRLKELEKMIVKIK